MTDLFSIARAARTETRPEVRAETRDEARAGVLIRLSREQVVDQILTINHSATADYLSQFAEPQLSKYLDHLLACQEPRGRLARWDRPGDAPAIMTRRRAS
jgi:hypothetical protein